PEHDRLRIEELDQRVPDAIGDVDVELVGDLPTDVVGLETFDFERHERRTLLGHGPRIDAEIMAENPAGRRTAGAPTCSSPRGRNCPRGARCRPRPGNRRTAPR